MRGVDYTPDERTREVIRIVRRHQGNLVIVAGTDGSPEAVAAAEAVHAELTTHMGTPMDVLVDAMTRTVRQVARVELPAGPTREQLAEVVTANAHRGLDPLVTALAELIGAPRQEAAGDQAG